MGVNSLSMGRLALYPPLFLEGVQLGVRKFFNHIKALYYLYPLYPLYPLFLKIINEQWGVMGYGSYRATWGIPYIGFFADSRGYGVQAPETRAVTGIFCTP
jgi:hypothetical protein